MRKIFNKLLPLLLGFLLAFSFAGCGSDSRGTGTTGENGGGSENPPEPEVKTYEVFPDAKFSTGFDILGTGYTDDGKIDAAERDKQKSIKFGRQEPVWHIAQWYSRNKLEKTEPIITETSFALSDSSKSVKLNRETGEITLDFDASKDFSAPQHAATLGSFWPHLLLSPTSVESVKISDCESMEVRIDFTLNKSVSHAKDFGVSSLELNSQFAWFVYVSNLNPGEGYGEFLWLGFNLYDPKRVYAPHNAMQDNAGGVAGNYIYTFGADETIGKDKIVKVGKRTGFTMDLKVAVKTALDDAHKAGFMMHTTVDNASITGMNIGYEMFDVWELSATIHDMGVRYTKKENAV